MMKWKGGSGGNKTSIAIDRAIRWGTSSTEHVREIIAILLIHVAGGEIWAEIACWEQ
jgi:hypothetical protein